jgi:hypothetical protein
MDSMWIPSFHMEFPSGMVMEYDLYSITIPDGFHHYLVLVS